MPRAVGVAGGGLVRLLVVAAVMACGGTTAPTGTPSASVSTMLEITGGWVGCNEWDRCSYGVEVVGRLIDLDLALLPAAEGNALAPETPGPWYLPPGSYDVTFISGRRGAAGFEERSRCSTRLDAGPTTAALTVSVLFRPTTCEIHVSEAIVD